MKKLIGLVVALCTLFLLPLWGFTEEYNGRVVGVSDGDTLTLLVDGKRQVKVRLAERSLRLKKQYELWHDEEGRSNGIAAYYTQEAGFCRKEPSAFINGLGNCEAARSLTLMRRMKLEMRLSSGFGLGTGERSPTGLPII